jgi:antitoxin HicB
MKLPYRILLDPDSNDTFLVTCPALREVTTFGQNELEAMVHARHAIEEALAARISEGHDIPPPESQPNRSQSDRWREPKRNQR